MSDNNHDKYIDIDNFNPDKHIKTESPLIYHVYNDKSIKSFQNYLPFFYRIYNGNLNHGEHFDVSQPHKKMDYIG